MEKGRLCCVVLWDLGVRECVIVERGASDAAM